MGLPVRPLFSGRTSPSTGRSPRQPRARRRSPGSATAVSPVPLILSKERRGREIFLILDILMRQVKEGSASKRAIANTVSRKLSQKDTTIPKIADFRAWWLNSGLNISRTNRNHLEFKGWTDLTSWERSIEPVEGDNPNHKDSDFDDEWDSMDNAHRSRHELETDHLLMHLYRQRACSPVKMPIGSTATRRIGLGRSRSLLNPYVERRARSRRSGTSSTPMTPRPRTFTRTSWSA
ncbi:hypothetical protein IMZ48_45060 [Candidatus Bathyarchaeota archaeon]|nr:hypothetical protein [Candidatus Bathyarchaeota archaeon]